MGTDSIKISLDSIQTTTGLLVALAVSIAGLWVVVARPQWINVHHFRQARGLATPAIAVGLALVFVSWANVDGLPRLSRAAILGVPLCIATFLINVVVQILGSHVIVGIPTVGFSLPFGGRIANCPGGGHGELVLSGTYVGTQTAEAPFATTLSGSISGSTLSLPLPLAPDVRLTQATLQFFEAGRQVPGADALVLALGADGSVTEETANQLFAVHRQPDRLEISRRQ